MNRKDEYLDNVISLKGRWLRTGASYFYKNTKIIPIAHDGNWAFCGQIVG